MPEDRKAILLRISPQLWESLNRWAGDDLRSLNGQIEWILREAVRRREGARADDASGDASKPVGAE